MNCLTRKKILIGLSSAFFLGAFVCGIFSNDSPPAKNSQQEKENIPSSSKMEEKKFFISPQKKESIALVSFLKKLQTTPNISELNRLFENLFAPNLDGVNHSDLAYVDFMRGEIIRKWGEAAPLQGLEKLKNQEKGEELLGYLFSGWASKNPEAAAAYYDQNGMEYKKAAQIIKAILSEYAEHSPQKAKAWLQAHENNLIGNDLKESRTAFLRAVSESHPALIPELVKEDWTDAIKEELYTLALNWGTSDSESREWIDTLPTESRPKAEAGRIMGVTRGNLEKIKTEVLKFTPEERLHILKELANEVIRFGGLDMKDRMDWVVESLPEADMPDNLKFSIGTWVRDDLKDGKKWLESLPPGSKKDFILKCRKETMYGEE